MQWLYVCSIQHLPFSSHPVKGGYSGKTAGEVSPKNFRCRGWRCLYSKFSNSIIYKFLQCFSLFVLTPVICVYSSKVTTLLGKLPIAIISLLVVRTLKTLKRKYSKYIFLDLFPKLRIFPPKPKTKSPPKHPGTASF